MEVAAPASWPLPVPASVLADKEAKRRDAAVELGRCTTGCADLDDYVLMGGFERGSVVGLSAEDDEVGLQLGLQMLARSLCSDNTSTVSGGDGGGVVNGLVVTPKPATAILVNLRDAIKAEMRAQGATGGQVAARTRECLDRVMLSCVFDLDGLWEVLADLDRPAEPTGDGAEVEAEAEAAGAITDEEHIKSPAQVEKTPPVLELDEIGDSQEDDDELLSSPPKPKTPKPKPPPPRRPPTQPPRQGQSQTQPKQPAIILVTHFSSLLTSLFTHREKSVAHSTLQRLGVHLRDLTRNLPSSPLVLLVNSTSSSFSATESGPPPTRRSAAALDPTLRSIFSPPPPPPPGAGAPPHVGGPSLQSSSSWRNKPSFGLVFSQLLDLHLLCTRIPRAPAPTGAASAAVPAASHPGGGGGGPLTVGVVWVVEVLLDNMGVWQGRRGARPDREQRWTALDIQGGRFSEAFPKTRTGRPNV